MAKLKLTKNELKKQKDALKMFKRYLPTLMLKKQQLQAEIRSVELRVKELRAEKTRMDESFKSWIAVFGERNVFTPGLLKITKLLASEGNIAGVPIPVFKGAEFEVEPYSLILKPLWLDAAVESMKKVLLIDLEAETMEEQQRRLERELRTTTQRVNLFEKVKIPECKRNIKKIQVYLGDEQTAAVVRGKISKRAMERVAS
ncbi:MAG: V-type ATP synthase subunit D [Spirochaetaceae bacterium]|jgi:V/A-type H+-transporting ATPase subunit D|nr:V-type ATP synthase subunit D [Spirochaetaceae bacterium]GMO26662.1 MAG: V-type ATP synthase subunit D [Termitinemataceae bacterium]